MTENMWKNSLKNVESDKNKVLYEKLFDFLQRNGTYFLNKPRHQLHISMFGSQYLYTAKGNSSQTRNQTIKLKQLV